jgi:PAS domain S-box-containing protein
MDFGVRPVAKRRRKRYKLCRSKLSGVASPFPEVEDSPGAQRGGKAMASDDQAQTQHRPAAAAGEGEARSRSPRKSAALDVAGRKKAEKALRESEAKYRTLVEQIPAIIYIAAIDPTSTTTYVSPQVETILGYTAADYRSDPDLWLNRLHPGDRDRVLTELAESRRADRPFASEYRMLAKDGRVVCMRDEAAVVRDEEGRPLFLQGVMLDITERKKAEAELRKFKAVTDAAPHGSALSDLAGNLQYVNDAFARMHGYTPAELVGRHLSIFHTPEQMPEVNRLLEVARQKGLFTGEEVWHVRRDGTTFPTLMDVAVITDDRGEPAFLSGMAIDLSEQKRVLEDLQRQALVFDSITDGVIITDRRNQIVDWNSGAERIFGYRKEEVLRRNPEILNRAEEARSLTGSIHKGLSKNGCWSGEIVFLRKDRTEGVCDAFLVPLRNERGEWIGTVAVNRDITARKHAEEEKARLEAQLAQAQKMEAVGTLASGIAHDLNNLLTAIFGYTDLAKTSLSADHPAGRSLEMVEEAGLQARGVVTSLLAFTQKREPEKAPVNLVSSLRNSIHLLRRLLPALIDVEEDLGGCMEVWVEANAAQLQQVWMNLAVNARDAMPHGGRLGITLRVQSEATAGQDPSGEMAEVRGGAVVVVEDTGTGMSEEVRARIFEPYFTTKPRGQGTGLGMSVTHATVTNHGGQIEVESWEGRGTRVTIRLPCCGPPPERTSATSRARERSGHGEVILVVENDELVRSILVSSLRVQGYEATWACDATEALAKLRRRRAGVSLAVVDLDLPKGGGLPLLDRIRRKRAAMPILIITGRAEVPAADQLRANECLLRKPFQVSELGAQVASLLEKIGGVGESR